MNNITEIVSLEELMYLWLSDKSKTTVNTYRHTIKQFMEFVGKDLEEIRLEDLVMWRQRLQLTYGEVTVNNKLRHIKSLLSYGYKIGYLEHNFGSLIKLGKEKNRISEKILEIEDVQLLINGAKMLRDKLLLKLIYVCGLRVSEAIALQWRDLRRNKLTVFGKGGKTRILLVPDWLVEQLQQLRGGSSFIFVSKNGNKLHRSMVHTMIKRTAQRMGINPELSSHWLRHSHATHALEAGCNLRLLQQSLGHSNISTTERYLRLNPREGSSDFMTIQ
ncbi:integrase/recombinase XerD (plasmid) [Cyanobacterium sp. HL-69]|uniref:tyrosine-type recombinase/integrase n=1 Tax=Cyanobacterium sp. HL-69 TaxID=2054282 RepID=UPI000CA3F258|nr:integrase/recombinase XerD [Cyanobacterium sp. HL-69]